MATILRAFNDDNVKYDLDLFNNEQFLLDISSIEAGEIGKVFGISSQNFALPATTNNQEYFGYLDNIGADGASSFTKRLPCQVLNDGIEIFSGFITLDSVITNSEGDTIYNVVVVNEIVDFKLLLENKTFGDLDWSDYNHNLTYTNISQSWDNDLFNGEVVYPLVEYGIKGENDSSQRYIANGGIFGSFTSQFTPLSLLDFKPAIRVSTIMNKIFSSVGYSYTSSFLEDAHADKIYVLATRDDNRGVATTTAVSQSMKVTLGSSQALNANDTFEIIEFDNEVFDNANNYDTGTFRYTAKTQGQYSFATQMPITLDGISNANTPRECEITLSVNGVTSTLVNPVWVNLKGKANNSTFTINASFAGLTLNVSDYVSVRVTFFSEDSSERFTIASGEQSYFECYSSPSSTIGGNVNLGGCFNPNDKVLDFVNGVIQKFNLVMEPLGYDKKVFSIETFNTWVDNGVTKDWSDLVDRNVKWQITHPIRSNTRTIYFSDIDDNDALNKYAKDNFGRTFGDYTYDSDADLANGQKRVGSYFAPTPMKYIDGDTNVIIPQLYASKNGGKSRIAFKPRLLYYLGLKQNNTLYQRAFLGSSNISVGEWYIKDESDVTQTQLYYPQFHHVEELPANSSTTRDLHFNAFQHWEFHQPYANANTIRDAVYEYYSFYINELFDVDSRLVKMNIVLKPSDVPTIQLNDKIFIDGHYYRVNKLQANLARETSVEVELLKVLVRKLRFPRRRIFDIDNVYTDIVAEPSTTGGTIVNYYDYETQTPITSSVLINEAGNLDGFQTIGGVASFTPTETTIQSNNFVRGAGNFVDSAVNDATIVGGGNYVGSNATNAVIYGNNNNVANSSNATIIGSNLTMGGISGSVDNAFVISYSQSISIAPSASNVIALLPNRDITAEDNNIVLIGNSRTIGSHYEEYNNVAVSAGSSAYITGSSLDFFHHHFEWSGGAGTANVYLPSASLAENDSLQLRLTTDSNVSATNIVNLRPSDGNIDANPEEALTTPYDGLLVQIINSNYQIIQRK